MPIIYNEKTREFHLYNQEISYIIKILDNDQPGQLYYGKRLTHREDFGHLFEYAMRDMSPYRGKFYILTGEYQAGVSDFRLRRYAFSGI